MIIVFLTPSLKNIGPTRQLMMLVQALLKKKYEVHIVTFPRSLVDNEKKNDFTRLGAKVHELYRSKTSMLKNILQLKNLINNLEADVVHSHLFYADLISALALRGYRTVCTLRSIPIEELTLRYGVLIGYLVSVVHTWAVKQIRTRVACSETVMRYYSSKGVESFLIRNAVPSYLEHFYKSRRSLFYKQKAREILKVPENVPLAIMVGSLDDRKNPIFIIELFTRFLTLSPSAHLLIVGDGGLKNQCISKAKANPQIRIEGFVVDVTPYYEAADIILSSSVSEGLPNSIIEGICANTPSLISDIPQHRELELICPDLVMTCPSTREIDGEIFKIWLGKLKKLLDMFERKPYDKHVDMPLEMREVTMISHYEATYIKGRRKE